MKQIIYTLILLFIVSPATTIEVMASENTNVSEYSEESPKQVDGATTINGTEAKALFDKGVVFIDTRRDADWDAGRIPDAVHLNFHSNFTEATMLEVVSKDAPVVFYCNGFLCMRSSRSIKKAVSWGFEEIYYFRNGLPAWKNAGYLIE